MVRPSFPVASEARTRASLEAEFTRAVTTPGLSALVGREWEALFPRFARYYERLTRLPRRTRRALQRQWKQSLAALALLLALGQAPALAATINVDGTICTLVDAITAANTDTATGCPAGDPGLDTLNLVAGSTHTLTVVNNTTIGATGLPLISSTITIEGNGSTITRDGSAPAFRILAVFPSGNLTLNETTVSGGLATGSSIDHRGGGVYNIGAVTLTNTTVSGNSAGLGGGVFINNGGAVTLTNTTVSGNSAGFSGGGVFNVAGTVTLTNSTISGNTVAFSSRGAYGGGVFNNAGRVTLTNSTVSGNYAFHRGGGVYSLGFPGTVILTDSTISGNIAGLGGGVYNSYHSTMTLHRTLVSGNTTGSVGFSAEISNDPTNYNPNLPAAVVTADDFNLFGHSGLTNTQAFFRFTPGASDISATSDCTPGPGCIPTALANILAPLASNLPGPTQTHALVAGSPAIDMSPVDANCEATDQRGVSRPQGPACDIGAFELEPPTTTTTTSTTTTTVPTTTTTVPTTTTTVPTTTTTTMPPPANADLAVTKTDSPDPVQNGHKLTYTVTVTNNGPSNATGVTMTDTLPAGVRFVSATPSQGTCSGTSTVTCTLGSLAASRQATVILKVKPTAAGTITNTAGVTGNQADPTPANNSATQKTKVRR